MSHVTIKSVGHVAAAMALVGLMAASSSCGSSSSTESAASGLLSKAESALNGNRYEEAMLLLDSIDHAYPEDLTVRSAAMKLRPKAIEGYTREAIAEADSIISQSERTVAELTTRMNMHENREIGECYYAPKATDDASFINSTGVALRVDAQTGGLYVVSSVNPGHIGQRYVVFTDGTGGYESTDTLASGTPANFVSGNSELLEFLPRYCTRLAEYVAANTVQSASIGGDNGTRAVKISAKTAEAMTDAARLSLALSGARKAAMERERLLRNLEVAQSQQAGEGAHK